MLLKEEKDFFSLLRLYFPAIYDVKYLMKSCKRLKGGLQVMVLPYLATLNDRALSNIPSLPLAGGSYLHKRTFAVHEDGGGVMSGKTTLPIFQLVWSPVNIKSNY